MHRLIKIRIIRDFERLEDRVRRWRDAPLEFEAPIGWRPAADLYETPQGLVLRLEVAGVAKEDLSLSLAGQELIIRGRRRPSHPEGATRLLLQEMGSGAFERNFQLPIPIDPQRVEARYADGVLEVRLPRPLPQTRRIPVKEGSSQE
jgi:HSP20 family protein